MTIKLDLRRGLPKVRAQLEAILPNIGSGLYSAPCAVGAMMTEKQRECLFATSNDVIRIDVLISDGQIAVPEEQRNDFVLLQSSFDHSGRECFEAALARLEAKYGLAPQ